MERIRVLCSSLFVAALVSGCKGPRDVNTTSQLLTARVTRSDIEDAVLATGTLHALQQVDVGTRVTGQVKTLNVVLGQPIRRGELLAEIDPVLPANELRSAQANLHNLEAQQQAAAARLRRARLELKRQRQLIVQDATALQVVQSAESEVGVEQAGLTALAAQIDQAKVQVDTAKANLDYTRITAPIDGEVVAITTQQGQTVVAAQLVPVILKLAKVDTMTVKTQISEADVIRIGIGQVVYFTIMGDQKRRYYGTLRAIEPAPKSFADASSHSTSSNDGAGASTAVFYNAIFDVDNGDKRLRIGMTAQVSVVLAEANQVLTIPSSALGTSTEESRYSVRVLGPDGHVELRTIRIGINNNVLAEVREGLSEGETVVTGEGPSEGGRSSWAL